MRDGTPGRTRLEWEEKDEELKSILQNLDLLMPKVTFSDVSTTTSAKDSKAVLLNRKDSYCVGDSLTARLDLYDHLGNRKEYGGDFLQARIFSSKLKAGASGLIEDYKNGTYLVNFTLLWEGNVSVSISLIHPSEGASALWAARKRGYDKVAFTGTYLKGTSNLFSECGLNVSTKSELCEYLDRRDKESFYCIKPKNVSCKALVRLKSYHKPITFLTALEERLFDRSNIGVEIPHTFGDIRVLACGGKKTTTASEKCRIGMTSPFPSGFLWQNQWHPLFCNVSTFSTLDLVNTCLKRKLIYLLGDSTLRQWIEYLPKRVNKETRMYLAQIWRPRAFLALVFGVFVILSYTFHRTDTKNFICGVLKKQIEVDKMAMDIGSRSELWPMKDGMPRHTRMEWAKKDKEIKAVLRKLDDLMPNVTFMAINSTTSAKNSKATILNYKGSYCVGEHLMVRLDLCNYLGKRKEYGGDFLRARIFSSSLRAGASGHLTDYRNGTYLVNFTLFWAGNIKVSLKLIHPSEGVSALWAARKRGYDKIVFTGKFLNETLDVFTECGFNLTTDTELCEYLDERDQEVFYCVKPKYVPCEAFVQLKSNNRPISYLTAMEKTLLNSVGIEIPQNFRNIRVVPCKTSKVTRDKCRIGMTSPVPSGYVLSNTWHPEFCSIHDFSTLDKIHACLKNKMIYLMGDSTSFQWISYITKRVTTLKYFDHQSVPVFKTHVALDLERNTFIQWKKHGYPLVTKSFYSVKDLNYIAREIDQVAGDSDTAIVIAVGQHFRPFPMDLFVRRVVNIRSAIERLLLRSPDTKVIVKAENIREMNADTERFGDFRGYAQYLAMKYIFRGLRVGVIDAWDMTIAYNTNTVHPPELVVWNQIMMFLTYLC